MRYLVRSAAVLGLVGLAGCVGAPAPGPVVYAPTANPAYAPPPAAPQGYAPVQPAAYSGTCYAGVYTCQLPQALPLGAQCSCPGLGAPSFGNVR